MAAYRKKPVVMAIQRSEIEITPEMIQAGRRALFPCELLPWQDEARVMAEVYRAMATCSRPAPHEGQCNGSNSGAKRDVLPKPIDPRSLTADRRPLGGGLKFDNSDRSVMVEGGGDDITHDLSWAAQVCEPK